MAKVHDNSFEALGFAVGVNACLLAAFVILFHCLLLKRSVAQQLAPRVSRSTSGAATLLTDGAEPPLPSLWRWIRDDDFRKVERREPDLAVLVRFHDLALTFSLYGCLLSVILIPLYATGSNKAAGMKRLTLSNVSEGDMVRFGVAMAVGYVFLAVFARLVTREWERFFVLRREYYRAAISGELGSSVAQAKHSIIVENIPEEFQTARRVRSFFDELFGAGSVHSCVMAGSTEENSDRCSGVVPADDEEHSELPQSPEARRRAHVPAIVQELGQDIGTGARGVAFGLQEATVGRRVASTAFVTFHRAAHALQAQQLVMASGTEWWVEAAPEPRDVIWPNVAKPLSQIRLRTLLVRALSTLGLLFWSVPVTMIQAWASVDSLQEWIPAVKNIRRDSPMLYTFATTYLPVVALMVLQTVLSTIFQMVAERYEGLKCKSAVQRVIINRVFSYRLATLYVTVLAGSLWDALQGIVAQPSSLLKLLSESLPKVAVYFITYLLAGLGTGLPYLLMQPLLWKCLSSTYLLAGSAAVAAIMMVIGLTYFLIAPIIFFPLAAYFAAAKYVHRWMARHVHEPEFDGGGEIWFDLFNSILLGLLLGTLSLVGIMLTFADIVEAVFLFPLPIFVIVLGWHCWRVFWRVSKYVPLQDALTRDQAEAETRSSMQDDFYLSPYHPPQGLWPMCAVRFR